MTSIPAGWSEVTLGEICKFKYGKSLPASVRDGGGFSVYGSNGSVGRHSIALTQGPAIIIGRKGSFGEVSYSPGACWPIDTAYFVDETATAVDLKWLSHLLPTLGLTELNRAAAIPGLNREDAYAKKVLLAPDAEQKRIAAVLDQVDTLRTERRKAIDLLEELGQSIFIDMFGDPAANLRGWQQGVVADLVGGFETGKNIAAGNDDSSSYRVLKVSAVTSGTYQSSESKPLPVEYVPPPKHLVRRGDLLFSRANTEELIGAVALVDEEGEGIALPDKIWRFLWRDTDHSSPLYVRQMFRQAEFRRQIRERSSGTSGSMKNISQKSVLGIPCGIPPYPLQRRFAERVEKISELQATHRAHLAALDELFASLQQRAFSGRLWEHEAA
ncbi:restriction endonuclease subunit S [Streptomyces sp. NPDC090303]|uniref:restriction endonuclease subunit S n=1 Tax=Streptomyces sp. NPDC090303 TaxID=3365960 RepID=UPI0038294E68